MGRHAHYTGKLFNLRRFLLGALAALALGTMYFYKLDGIGVIGPDEPRYAAIGRTMAHSGDLVTPVLWGKPWFEKPPLLYWITAAATRLGLGPDLCARLPVVLLSLAFLAVMYWLLVREYGRLPAAAATLGLATSAGWLIYSSFGLTDLPLAVAFSLAVLLALPLLRSSSLPSSGAPLHLALIGVCIGFASLAKGLVPFALAIPFFWYLRPYWKQWWIAVASTLAVALPWYILVYLRNGFPFVQDFFIRHHLQRLYSSSLEHTQPVYYYLPVLLAGLFPWTPAFFLLARRPWSGDRRYRFLLTVALFGFAFFSLTRNKLPHYVMPILPALFIALASRWEGKSAFSLPRPVAIACALLVGLLPAIAVLLPPMIAIGRVSASALPAFPLALTSLVVFPLALVFLLPPPFRPVAVAACSILGMLYLKSTAYPVIDRTISPRSYAYRHAAELNRTCNGGTNRDWLYGINYYRGVDLPACESGHFVWMLHTANRGTPELLPVR
jgi:4-amino-4-deoxy-L-arabinose transferase-like glycosyltransferase